MAATRSGAASKRLPSARAGAALPPCTGNAVAAAKNFIELPHRPYEDGTTRPGAPSPRFEWCRARSPSVVGRQRLRTLPPTPPATAPPLVPHPPPPDNTPPPHPPTPPPTP